MHFVEDPMLNEQAQRVDDQDPELSDELLGAADAYCLHESAGNEQLNEAFERGVHFGDRGSNEAGWSTIVRVQLDGMTLYFAKPLEEVKKLVTELMERI